jgi:hypothetical protein
MEKTQTSVEWLALELYEKFEMKGDGNLFDTILSKAKEMEKKQIIQFADKYDAYVVQGGTLTAEQYYNETFNQD